MSIDATIGPVALGQATALRELVDDPLEAIRRERRGVPLGEGVLRPCASNQRYALSYGLGNSGPRWSIHFKKSFGTYRAAFRNISLRW